MRIECSGFFDLQVNGFAGVDFNSPDGGPDEVGRAIEAMRRTGVTRCLPTLVTSSFEHFRRCARRLLSIPDQAIAGLHMEGPYISPQFGARGAHPLEHVREASPDDYERRQEAAEGRILLVTLAPEVPGALALIEYLVKRGIRVAIGHTSATSAQIQDAIAAGATLSTHLGNGCALLLPRHPNVLWDQLAADELFASLIVDGHHLPVSAVRVMVRAKSPSRTILITDAIAAAGCPPGSYQIGSTRVELDASGRVSLPGERLLAGSSLTINKAIGNVVEFTGLGLEEVLLMASDTPAAFLGLRPAGRVFAEWDPETFTLRVDEVATPAASVAST